MQDIRAIYVKLRANRWKIAQTSDSQRIAKLKKLRDAIFANQDDLKSAIYDDFKKNPGEVDLTEIFPTISEINHSIKHLSKWMKPHKVKTPMALAGTHSEVRLEPKGVVLILSPWNYPFQLLMSPLVAALSAGNCVMIKPSSKVPHTSAFCHKLLSFLFDENEVAVIEGDSKVADALLEFPFDHIFFTGSPPVGKKIMAQASRHLTPVTLELGGKSPVILDETANIKKAAERIMWGKFVNAGQTCVAPDYLLIHANQESEFIAESKKVIEARYGKTPQDQEQSASYCRLVSQGHLKGLKEILEASVAHGAKIETGGKITSDQRYLAPTLLSKVTDDSPIMKEEIFGPILPILTYKNLKEVFQVIHSREKPLALYIFSENKKTIETILKNTTAGGTCVNSLLIHLANADLPFGGVGQSGMGNYHGYYGFRTFSHERAVLKQGKLDSLRLFYPPYTSRVQKLIKLAVKYLG